MEKLTTIYCEIQDNDVVIDVYADEHSYEFTPKFVCYDHKQAQFNVQERLFILEKDETKGKDLTSYIVSKVEEYYKNSNILCDWCEAFELWDTLE